MFMFEGLLFLKENKQMYQNSILTFIKMNPIWFYLTKNQDYNFKKPIMFPNVKFRRSSKRLLFID